VRGCNNTPLIYVIRKVRTPTSLPFTTTEEERIYLTSHRGAAYNKDDQTVFHLLTQMLSGTGVWTWICMFETAKNGKGALWSAQEPLQWSGSNQETTRIRQEYLGKHSFFIGETV
jgi:hypothetical protein